MPWGLGRRHNEAGFERSASQDAFGAAGGSFRVVPLVDIVDCASTPPAMSATSTASASLRDVIAEPPRGPREPDGSRLLDDVTVGTTPQPGEKDAMAGRPLRGVARGCRSRGLSSTRGPRLGTDNACVATLRPKALPAALPSSSTTGRSGFADTKPLRLDRSSECERRRRDMGSRWA